MSYEEIVAEEGDYRVKLVLDECADQPYYYGQSPIVRLDHAYHTWRSEHVMVGDRPTDDDERIEEAAQRWGSDIANLERYLRAFYGVTQIKRYDTRDYIYITYDSARWREFAGFTDEHPMPADSIDMDEWQAWCEGEVYGYVVQKRVRWSTDDADYDDMSTWEDVEDGSCWSLYGMEYAQKTALEAFKEYAEEKVAA